MKSPQKTPKASKKQHKICLKKRQMFLNTQHNIF